MIKKTKIFGNSYSVNIVATIFSFQMSPKTLNLVNNCPIYDDIRKYTKLREKFSKFLVKI